MVAVAGTILGIALARLAGPQQAWLRAAVLAQAADLVTFAAMWDHGQRELNPLVRASMQAALGLFDGAHAISVLTVGLAMMSLKLGLIGYLIHGSAYFGPYRRVVLSVAIVLGGIGAFSNVITYWNSVLPLIVVAAFAVVAARWPSRFWDAVGAAIRLLASACFALAALAAFAYLPSVDVSYLCGPAVCRPLVGPLLQMLAINLVVTSLLALWISVRYAARFVPYRVVRVA